MSEWNFNPQVTRTRVFSNFLFQILCFKNQIQVCELKFRESEIFHGQYSRWPVHLCLVPWAAGDWGSFLGWLSTKHDPFFPRLCWCPILSQIYLYTQSTVYMYICMYIYIILYYNLLLICNLLLMVLFATVDGTVLFPGRLPCSRWEDWCFCKKSMERTSHWLGCNQRFL